VLSSDFAKLCARYKVLDASFLEFTQSPNAVGFRRYREWHALEGVLSSAWQAWSGFCRSVVTKSCTGTMTRSGFATVPLIDIPDAGRLAYVAKAIAHQRPVRPQRTLLSHQEPTWGDRALLEDLVRYLNPSNSVDLLNGILLATRAPEDMRTVRNATAHINCDNARSIEQLKIHYLGHSVVHPTGLLKWQTKGDREFVFSFWLSEILEVADAMTS
jgi:hypothetical protein